MTSRFPRILCYIAAGLLLFLGVTGCQKKPPVVPSPLCTQAHKHIVSLLQKEISALSASTTKDPKQQKKVDRYNALLKNLTSSRGKERSLRVCTLSSKNKTRLAAHECASKAISIQAVQRCYKPPKPTPSTKPAKT